MRTGPDREWPSERERERAAASTATVCGRAKQRSQGELHPAVLRLQK